MAGMAIAPINRIMIANFAFLIMPLPPGSPKRKGFWQGCRAALPIQSQIPRLSPHLRMGWSQNTTPGDRVTKRES
jgi:hypothetical protein